MFRIPDSWDRIDDEAIMSRSAPPKAIVLGLGSAIGHHVARRLKSDGWRVIGTARDKSRIDSGVDQVICCHLDDKESIQQAEEELKPLSVDWSLLFVAAGTMKPIGKFFDLDASDWERGLQISALGPLRLLRAIWSTRSLAMNPTVCFLAGGGTNNDFPNYSAYCISKIMLIKMMELLQSEEPTVRFVIVGPGYAKTPIHNETILAGDAAGSNYERTKKLLEDSGTPLETIYRHVMSCHMGKVEEFGGRNFSTVHDDWEDGSIIQIIQEFPDDAFRLRRFPYVSPKADS